MSGPESPQWHTASIKRLKSFLSLPADASAQQVADTLMAKYRAEAYNGTPYLLDLLAIRYAASGNYYKRYNPLPIAKTLDYNICAVLEENALSLPGIAVSQSSIREYPEKAHQWLPAHSPPKCRTCCCRRKYLPQCRRTNRRHRQH